MQFVWFLARDTRVGRPQREIMLWELPSELEVGPLIAMPLVRGRGTVLGTHRAPSHKCVPPNTMAGLRRAAYQIQPLSIIRNLLDRPPKASTGSTVPPKAAQAARAGAAPGAPSGHDSDGLADRDHTAASNSGQPHRMQDSKELSDGVSTIGGSISQDQPADGGDASAARSSRRPRGCRRRAGQRR